MNHVEFFILKRCQRYHLDQINDARLTQQTLLAFNATMPVWPEALWRRK